VELYDFEQQKRNHFNAMVSVVDSTVANVTAALHRRGLYDNTLIVWTTDNGAPVQVAGSNAPFRGSKGSNWEGGVHVRLFPFRFLFIRIKSRKCCRSSHKIAKVPPKLA